MASLRVDIYSDTVTKPTQAMRRAMCEAEVGDEQKGEDPTVNRLQEMVADLLGKEAALFLPSGTMCNAVAFAVHCRPGDEIIMDRTAHPLHSEAGAPAAISGAQIRPLAGTRGVFSPEQVIAAIRPPKRNAPVSRLVSIEQTSNLGGGTCWPLSQIEQVCAAGKERGLAAHMDGARLMNAVVASRTPARAYAAPFDSVWIDFTKGLGAPVGAVLAGTQEFITAAWRWKQRLGGSMRQAGVVAAACIYALEHHVERLADDHEHAKLLARGLAPLPGITLDADAVETNIVIIDISETGFTSEDFAAFLLRDYGIRVSVVDSMRVRAVTHLDVDRQQIMYVIDSVAHLLTSASPPSSSRRF